eukprot:9614171-Lingulodinium_polyedra.AAC.1
MSKYVGAKKTNVCLDYTKEEVGKQVAPFEATTIGGPAVNEASSSQGVGAAGAVAQVVVAEEAFD